LRYLATCWRASQQVAGRKGSPHNCLKEGANFSARCGGRRYFMFFWGDIPLALPCLESPAGVWRPWTTRPRTVRPRDRRRSTVPSAIHAIASLVPIPIPISHDPRRPRPLHGEHCWRGGGEWKINCKCGVNITPCSPPLSDINVSSRPFSSGRTPLKEALRGPPSHLWTLGGL